MRTIVDLPAEHLKALDSYSRGEHISRAEAVRRAVAQFLPQAKAKKSAITDDPAFGSWKRRKVDGLKLQRRLRAEWDR